MNKILAHVILNYFSFSFNFIKIEKNVPTFLEFGLYIYVNIFLKLIVPKVFFAFFILFYVLAFKNLQS